MTVEMGPTRAVADAGPLRILFFGTHPLQFNGYSKVVYELSRSIARLPPDRVALSIFGFQNFYGPGNGHREDLPPSVDVYDAAANENPRAQGFGIGQVRDVVALKRPHVVVVYNDLHIIQQVLNELKDIPPPERATFKILLYVDQVYACQRSDMLEFANAHADAAMAFTPSWRTCLLDQGMTLPCDVLEHGVNPRVNYPVPRRIARAYFGLDPDDFIVLNLNRNQPRKRWDTCMKAIAQVVSNHVHDVGGRRIKFLVGTAAHGAWDLLALFRRELKKREVAFEIGMRHIIFLDAPQKLTDEDVNTLYNASDCGINTADGEGVGLCSVEAAAVGVPQIVPRLGGFVDFFDDSCALMIDPRIAYYVDFSRDAVGGEALMCDYADFADAIETYYSNPELAERHGRAARQKILKTHRWSDIAEHFVDIAERVHGKRAPAGVENVETLNDTSLNDTKRSTPDDDVWIPVAGQAAEASSAEASAVVVSAGAIPPSKKARGAKRGALLAELVDMRRRLDAMVLAAGGKQERARKKA